MLYPAELFRPNQKQKQTEILTWSWFSESSENFCSSVSAQEVKEVNYSKSIEEMKVKGVFK